MKKTSLYIALLAGALGTLAFTPTSTAADMAMPSCCGAPSAVPTAAEVPGKPDLLTTCPVSGEKLGEMGKPFTFTYQEQEVKLCCKGCKKDFDKDPAKYIKLIRAADKK